MRPSFGIGVAHSGSVSEAVRSARALVPRSTDLAAIAGFYKEWAAIGGGTGNYLTAGEFPENDVRDLSSLYFPRGIILNKDLSRVVPYDHEKVSEYIQHSWYEYAGGKDQGLHPYQGETKPKYDGPPTPWQFLQDGTTYTWMKAPRYDGKPMEVGPLSRMLVAFASGHEEARAQITELLGKLNVGPAALFSTLGRTGAPFSTEPAGMWPGQRTKAGTR